MIREVYGKGESERILGRLISEATPEVREKLYIATKCASRSQFLASAQD
jgi:aryl-alcohol dehydrogenase-like predicted oxidoreductase